jgi:hypothetical protein
MSNKTRPSAVGYQAVQDGPYASVRLAPEIHTEYKKLFESNDTLSKQRRAHLTRYFQRFCELGPRGLGEEKFKFEESFSDGRGGQVPVYAFKPFKWRLYGGILTVGGKRCFVGVRIDPSKKQNKANQKLLASAASDIADLLEYKREEKQNGT